MAGLVRREGLNHVEVQSIGAKGRRDKQASLLTDGFIILLELSGLNSEPTSNRPFGEIIEPVRLWSRDLSPHCI